MVSNLPKNWVGSNVFRHFKKFGIIKGEVKVEQTNDKIPLTFAYVTFAEREAAVRALSLNGNWVAGTKLTIVMKEDAESQSAAISGASPCQFPTATHTPSPFPSPQISPGSHPPTQGAAVPPLHHIGVAGSHATTIGTVFHSQPIPPLHHTAPPFHHTSHVPSSNPLLPHPPYTTTGSHFPPHVSPQVGLFGSPTSNERSMTPQLFHFIESQAKQDIALLRSRGGSFHYSGTVAITQASNGREHASFVGQVLERYKECSLPCSPDQWNKLVLIGSQGTRLVDELREPFKSHPNVQIHELSSSGQFQLLFVGVCDAVDSAFSHFSATLNKELQVESLVMQTLTKLKPGLAEDISKRYDVSLDGYSQHSAQVSFHGAPQNVQQAREEFERHVSSVSLYHVPVELPLQFLNSAMKLLHNDDLHVAILEDDGKHIGSFSNNDVQKVRKVLDRKPYQNSIQVHKEISSLSEEALEEICSNDCVRVRLEEGEIKIEGFVKEDVQQARILLQKSMKAMGSSHSLVCSPEQEAYLLNMFVSKESVGRVQKLEASLPACISLSKDKRKLFLKGTQDERDTSTQILLENVPLHYRSCSFTCHPAFYAQIKQQVLKQHATVESIESQGEKKEGKKEVSKFSIVLYASNPLDLETALGDLQNVEPGSLRVSFRPKARELIWNCKTRIEKQHNCRLEIRDKPFSRVLVHALTEEDREGAKAAIENHISENFVIQKEIPDVPLPTLQMKYLVMKHKSKLNEMKASLELCNIPFYLEHKAALALKEETLRVKVRGKLKQVEEAKECMDELALDFKAEVFEVYCRPAQLRMWCKRWEQLKQEQEANELIVEYDASDKSTTGADSSDVMKVPFVIYGSDTEAVTELKQSIQEEMQQELDYVTLKLSQDQVNAVGVGLKDRQLNIKKCVVDIRLAGPNIVLSAPKIAADDLSTVKGEIEDFLSKKTLSSIEFSSESAAVNLLLTSKKNYGYFALASKIGEETRVSLQPVCKGNSVYLKMRGSTDALEAAKLKLLELEVRIKQSLTTKEVSVEPLVAPALVPSFCQQIRTKLQNDHCVVATFPVQQIPITVLKEVYLQPSSSAIKVELHKGSLLCEKVDVVVNPSNEDLKHCHGLAKIVADAGGPSIQRESSQYVQEKGKLKSGEAICLGAGNLPYKKVIHVVGPHWQGGDNQEEQTLYLAVFNSLSLASSHGLGSIAIPAIGTGVFCVPEDVCASTSLKAVRDFWQSNLKSSLHTVIFSLFTPTVQKAFIAALPLVAPSEYAQEIHQARSPREDGRQPFCWEWMNDQRSFSPYSADICQVLTAEYRKNPRGCPTITINGTTYTIDFINMAQSNIVTGTRRKIRKTSAAKSSNWSFLGEDKQKFIPYSYQQACAIEAMYQAGLPSTLDICGRTYTFDFQQMVQINVQSSYRRPIQRTGGIQVPEASTNLATLDEIQEKKEPLIILEGLAIVIGKAEGHVKTKLQQSIQTETIPLLQMPGKRFEQSLEKEAQRHGVQMKVISTQLQATQKAEVELKGVKARVQRAIKDIQQLIIKQQLSSDTVDFPPEWQPQSQTTELQSVPQGSPEWARVEQKFKATLSSNVMEIVRVQNTWLWEKYIQHKKMMLKKNGADVSELELFHGTRKNDPRNVFEGEEGFDMRFSAQGMWGHANYFAVNASYSHSYAHTNTSGQKEMFLAKVLTGDSCQCPPNRSLRMPPEKQSAGGVQFSTNRYDTVTGQTNGSQVYMTYDNQKAYPAYLIRYH